MKFSRFVSLLAFAAALPSFAFAADSASVTALSGQARVDTEGDNVALAVGSSLSEGDVVETNTESSAEVTFPNGVKLVLGPGTRLKIRNLAISSTSGIFVCEITLLRGSITGDATGVSPASNFSIRTTAGVANVAGTCFVTDFSPTSSTTGDFKVTSVQGDVTLLPVNATGPVSIPAGKQASVGTTGTAGVPVNPAANVTLANARSTLQGGGASAVGGAGEKANAGPDQNSAAVGNPNQVNLTYLTQSSNGEGQRLIK